LRCAFERPALEGWTGELFALLGTFDQPFNQAPSLHVSLALILWACFRNHLRGAFKKVVAAYLTLVALSSLTTYQHQFIDVLTGLWAGLLVIAALPEQRTAQPAYKLTAFYLTGAIICTATAFAFRIWLLLWPGFALSMVACAYWTRNAAWLLQGPAALLMLPYTAAAWINSRLWTRGQPARNELADSVWIGRAPLHKNGMNSIVTLTPELRLKADKQVAMLDLLPPTAEQLNEAVLAIESLSKKRPTLVCCALGYSRSAVTAAAWLIAKGHANTPREALTRVQKARPQVILNPAHEACLNEWAERRLRNAN
jgi:hypothetical protein